MYAGAAPRHLSTPEALTDFDRYFLDGLYRAPEYMSAQAQRLTVTSVMRRRFNKRTSPPPEHP